MNPHASTKCAGRLLMALAAISSILLLAGCGSSGIPIPNNNGFSDSNLSGTYVLAISGFDVNGVGSAFAIVGAITADGKGTIMGGTVDINDPDLGGVFTGQNVTASSYNVSQDGRGTGKLVTPQGTFGLDFVLTSSSHGLITRFDVNGSGSGTLDLQGSATQVPESLAFSLSGLDAGSNPLGTVGAFALNGSGAVTSGIQDINDSGSSLGELTGLTIATTSSLVLTSGTNGTAVLTTSSSFGSLGFDVWVIDSTHLKLIETDASGVTLSGDAFTQQTSFNAGQLVFTLSGLDSTLVDPVVAGGYATATSNGGLSNGLEDYNDAGTPGTLLDFNGSCTTFVAGRCQLTLPAFSNGIANEFQFAAYPSSGGALLLEIDGHGGMQGAAYAQSATSFTVPAGYGLNLSGVNTDGAGDVGEVDDIAQFNATSAVSPATNMTGVLDENSLLGGPVVPPSNLSGTYTPDPTPDGRGSISVTTSNTFIGGLTLQYYVVDSSTVIFIEVDQDQLSVGTFEAQSTPGGAVKSRVSMVHPALRPHAAAAWPRK
jgi:hypothetical protein